MVLVQLPTVLLRVNQSKVRRNHDEWHDVQIPHLEGPPSANRSGSSTDEVDNANASFVSEHEVCYHFCCDKDPVDCVEVLHTCSGIGAYLSHQGESVAPAVDLQFTNKKCLQQSIAAVWKNLVRYDSSLVILHAITPKDVSMCKELWSFCIDVVRWQSQREKHCLVVAPNTSQFWSSRSSRTLRWMGNMYCVRNQSSDGSAYIATNLPSGWMKRLVGNLPFLHEGASYDSKFVTLLASCLQGEPSCDSRQVFLFEDLFEDMEDGLLCSLSLRHDRSSLRDTIFPHDSLISKMKPLSEKLPVGSQYVLPQRFVTSSLVQSLKKVDSMRPGVEVEINSSTDIARELRPLMQRVRVMTLPHLSFEHCSVYRGTLGKVSPVLQKDPASVVLMWEPGDFEKVFCILVNQLRTFYEKLDLTKWCFIVFSGETTGKLLRDVPTDQGSMGSDDPSLQYPPVPGGDLSDPDLNEPGGPTPFDVDDEDMRPGIQMILRDLGRLALGLTEAVPTDRYRRSLRSILMTRHFRWSTKRRFLRRVLRLMDHQGLPLAPYRNTPIQTFRCHTFARTLRRLHIRRMIRRFRHQLILHVRNHLLRRFCRWIRMSNAQRVCHVYR